MNITSEVRKKLVEAIKKEDLQKLFYEEIDSVWLDETTKENYKALKQPNSILIKVATTVFSKEILDVYMYPSIFSIAKQNKYSAIPDSKEIANILLIYFSKDEIQDFLDEIDEAILGNKPKARYNREDF